MSKMSIIVTGGSGFIGSHLLNILHESGFTVFNLDIKKPSINLYNIKWINCDIMDFGQLKSRFSEISPDYIIHLAARIDTDSDLIEDYSVNTKGTFNVINCANEQEHLKKIIVTSTQYVYRDLVSPIPSSNTDFKPHTVYGESKALSEKITREESLKPYVIIRPTNIWGPYNLNYANNLFKIIEKGIFALPKNKCSKKSFGYVKNICHQIRKILKENNNKEVIYVGEEVIDSSIWLSALSKRLIGKTPRRIPNYLLYMLSLFGEFLKKVNIKFPLYLTRYHNMIDDYLVPISETIDKYGIENKKLDENVDETINWYIEEHKKN